MTDEKFQIVMRLNFTREQIASLDRMVEASGVRSRTAFVQSLVREVIADEIADSTCVAVESTTASKCA